MAKANEGRPTCKLCRRERQKLFLKGERCNTPKCVLEKRKFPPGQHGDAPTRLTEYGIRMREKQKARRIYGLRERQFSNYFEKAANRPGVTGDLLFELLERRLDNVVYRLSFAASRREARQLVGHGNIKVNGRRLDIPSYQVKANDKIELVSSLLEKRKEGIAEGTPPLWLIRDGATLAGQVSGKPSADDAKASGIEYPLIVEYYSQ